MLAVQNPSKFLVQSDAIVARLAPSYRLAQRLVREGVGDSRATTAVFWFIICLAYGVDETRHGEGTGANWGENWRELATRRLSFDTTTANRLARLATFRT